MKPNAEIGLFMKPSILEHEFPLFITLAIKLETSTKTSKIADGIRTLNQSG